MSRLVIACGLVLVAALACGGSSDENLTACEKAGGTVMTAQCCTPTQDFPNLCLIGACGCGPHDSRPVKVCACPMNQCFNGTACVPFGP